MRAYREKDYDDMAGRAVDRFLRGEVKLADAAVEEAMTGQLNPDQIERLVQSANTMAFLRMMDARKAEGAPDMTHEFDPVDTASVLQSIVGQTPFQHDMSLMNGEGAAPPPHTGPGSDEVPDEMSARRQPPGLGEDAGMGVAGGSPAKAPPIDDGDGPFPKGEKQKAKEDGDKPDKEIDKAKKEPPKPPEKDEKKEAAVRQRRMRKLASLLSDQYLQAELVFEENYERLARQFKLAHGGPSFEEFEKDAMALDDPTHGAIVLNLLRVERGLEPITTSNAYEKHASLVDHRVVTDNEAIRLFDRLVKIAAEASRVQQGAEHARALCS